MERENNGRSSELLPENLPKHLVFIPDGNRRKAKESRLSIIEGHRRGVETVRNLMRSARDLGIGTVTIWGFSTENWQRSPKEVKNLMVLFGGFLDENLEEIDQMGVKFRWLGNREDGRIPSSLKEKLEDAEEKTRSNTKCNLNIALNYGARDEIIRAVKKIADSGASLEEIDWNLIAQNLDTAGLPDPDLIIRTGEREDEGETKHTSGMFALQGDYAEWYFTPTLCPDFSLDELKKALAEFAKAKPRLGR